MFWSRFFTRLVTLIMAVLAISFAWYNGVDLLPSLAAYIAMGVVVSYLERRRARWSWSGLVSLAVFAILWGGLYLVMLVDDFVHRANRLA